MLSKIELFFALGCSAQFAKTAESRVMTTTPKYFFIFERKKYVGGNWNGRKPIK
jgi:hypothetical protein